MKVVPGLHDFSTHVLKLTASQTLLFPNVTISKFQFPSLFSLKYLPENFHTFPIIAALKYKIQSVHKLPKSMKSNMNIIPGF